MSKWLKFREKQLQAWLMSGATSRQLALAIALGFAIGCLPIVGLPTVLCTFLAIALRLNLPAMQAANCVALPFQIALVLPLARLGGRLFAAGKPALESISLHGSLLQNLTNTGSMAEHALGAWLLVAGPAVLLLTLGLTPVLERVPARSRNQMR